jgi:Protein of unknown function (DUF2815)
MNSKISIEDKKVMTPEFRISYPNLHEAKSFQGAEAKFGMTMLFDKRSNLDALKKAAQNAAAEKWGFDSKKWPKNLKWPFRDGDKERPDTKGYKNTIFVSASSKQKPGLVDQKRERIEKDDERFGAGVYCRAVLIAFAYDTAGNRGVSFSLQNVQLLRDAERFTGRKNPEDEFDEVEDASEKTENYAEETTEMDIGF